MVHQDGAGRVERERTTGRRRGRTLGGGTMALAVGIALVLGVIGGAALGVLVRAPVAGPATGGTDYLFLTIGFDFATGLDRYLPANFTVPTHTLVVVTITNFDNASNPVPSAAGAVRGTVGNVMVMRSADQAVGMTMNVVPASQVAHTFTMDGGAYTVNVPVPAAASRATPMIVTFHAYFNVTGAFDWHCQAPCDPSSMNTPGFMRGSVTVVDA